MKNDFYFIFKAFFVLKIFIFFLYFPTPSFSPSQPLPEKLIEKYLKVYDVINWLNKNFKTYCVIS